MLEEASRAWQFDFMFIDPEGLFFFERTGGVACTHPEKEVFHYKLKDKMFAELFIAKGSVEYG